MTCHHQGAVQSVADPGRELDAAIALVGPNARQARESILDSIEQTLGAVAVRHVSRMDQYAEQQAQRIDEQMTLTAAQALGAIVTARSPFSVVFTDCESMTAPLGVGSRPACFLVRATRIPLTSCQRPLMRHFRK